MRSLPPAVPGARAGRVLRAVWDSPGRPGWSGQLLRCPLGAPAVGWGHTAPRAPRAGKGLSSERGCRRHPDFSSALPKADSVLLISQAGRGNEA